jgi:hypothetical protein
LTTTPASSARPIDSRTGSTASACSAAANQGPPRLTSAYRDPTAGCVYVMIPLDAMAYSYQNVFQNDKQTPFAVHELARELSRIGSSRALAHECGGCDDRPAARELGGHPQDPRNLWLQRWDEARTKDEQELMSAARSRSANRWPAWCGS